MTDTAAMAAPAIAQASAPVQGWPWAAFQAEMQPPITVTAPPSTAPTAAAREVTSAAPD